MTNDLAPSPSPASGRGGQDFSGSPLSFLWGRGLLLLGLAPLLLAGCGEDRPVSAPSPPAYHAPDRPALPKAATASSGAADPLLGQDSGPPTDDPLLSQNHASTDPLLKSDPLQGRTMPTDHSHWLRGSVRGAKLTVLLNGVRQGVYSGLVDKDITMRLRKGINSVTFVYEPHQSEADAQIDLVESEHHPPIAPLATFHSLPQSSDSGFQQTKQTFMFFAN